LTGTKVSLDVLQVTANKTSATAADIVSEMKRLDSQLQGVLSTWQGQAASRARLAFSDLAGKMSTLSNSLSQIGDALRDSRVHYEATDEQRAQDIGKVSQAVTNVRDVLVGG
jgi:WXG100 family type VII secretion target